MKRPLLVALACLVLAALAWGLVQRMRGPAMSGYEVVSRPLVQTVVATGRVVAVSRAQVGSPVTGVVVERRVREGDAVAPGDVLAVLRADDLEAAVREAEAVLAQLQQSTRPQAQASLREAEARLAQASREATRRRDLFKRQLIAREAMEQAVQAETIARSGAEQARLAARALAQGNPNEAAARARLATGGCVQYLRAETLLHPGESVVAGGRVGAGHGHRHRVGGCSGAPCSAPGPGGGDPPCLSTTPGRKCCASRG